MMRRPRVQTAQRTMVYMAVSLALTAAGGSALAVLLALAAERLVPHGAAELGAGDVGREDVLCRDDGQRCRRGYASTAVPDDPIRGG